MNSNRKEKDTISIEKQLYFLEANTLGGRTQRKILEILGHLVFR